MYGTHRRTRIAKGSTGRVLQVSRVCCQCQQCHAVEYWNQFCGFPSSWAHLGVVCGLPEAHLCATLHNHGKVVQLQTSFALDCTTGRFPELHLR